MNPRFVDQDNTFIQQLFDVFRGAAFLMPIAIVLIGLLVRFGYLNNTYYQSDLTFGAIAVLFTALGIWQFVARPTSARPQALLLAGYHVLAVAFLLMVSGFFSPFLICWFLLLVAVDQYFGTRAFAMSALILLATALLNAVLYPHQSDTVVLASFVACFFIAVIGFVISRIRNIADQERRALMKTREQENFQRERLLALVNSMGDAVATTDKNGIVRVYNAATLGLLDTNENITGKSIDTILHLTDRGNKAISLMEEATKVKGVITRTDLSHTFKDGESMKLYINMSPIRRGYRVRGESGYIIILRDITKEKSLEEERDEFISVVSHELRTPVAITEGNLSNVRLLLDRGAEKQVLTSAIDNAHEQVLYLAKMINDLGTLSRAERGVADAAEEIDVADMLHTMYGEYLPQAEAKKLRLDLNLSPKLPNVSVSRLYLEEIMQNLVTNAIKYTKEGTVTINAAKTREGVYLSVKDSGIGISKSDQKHIFEKFFRSEDYRTRETSGTGLGLYVVHKLAEKLHTQIEFSSRLNHGSTFGFLLKPSPTPEVKHK